ncbi:5-methyltetrahydropteroyltriglutamate--homocysteine S-methyltransferase [Fluviispira sanaruensis]|uniref:5-methyltetrahydropteroyltriglutamate--homocysteine methyltransferase n=1 Tax=Fluviispira sanaruensis TaxID=2493639 RepID=A0A4P2VIS5_FLUSA|nr:5-methyltetrahydropteroyltriglutamate--homocysteine S-methyltransferase [Fluviispira sanaruensis]BBH52641.1 5-methyltetrahydropteroyltriglutamate--homocysteine methyltransferase [Fluviispira sanaruensis]
MSEICTHILGYPRIGGQRELKKAVESYWKRELTALQLEEIEKKIKENNWKVQSEAGLSFVTVGDFANYDHVLDTSILLGNIPERFIDKNVEINLNTVFCMARGQAPLYKSTRACEMTKWFNTNYHYIVPEFIQGQEFKISLNSLFDQIEHANSLGYKTKPVLIGPLTYLWLGKSIDKDFNKLDLLEKLTQAYNEIFKQLSLKNIEWIQLDEPILSLEISEEWKNAFATTYKNLSFKNLKILLTTYFSSVEENLDLINKLPIHGLHVDLCSAPQQLKTILKTFSKDKILSLGIINGRNIWKADILKITNELQEAKKIFGQNLWLASSCSLLHSPVDLEQEFKLDGEIKNWLAFAKQKVGEIKLCADNLNNNLSDIGKIKLKEVNEALKDRRVSKRVHSEEVKKRISQISLNDSERESKYSERALKQREILKLPLFPTTTIGSFPQTQDIRSIRQKLKSGKIDLETYTQEIRNHILESITKQEALNIDVLVHGEAERNDMVEYFGELLEGFVFTSHGWVQSYGSRCVKPPIIFGDVCRPKPMTTEWAKYSQSLTKRPVKGMLTGPVTILSWSFVRDDQPAQETALQIAFALRDEVNDLENAGIKIIQIDEPAFREALPLKKSEWQEYLNWAVNCFRVSASGVKDSTQIHTHMCYSEFNDIIKSIADLDADVITIECSRSNMELLEAFENYSYPNEIGPGVYDIHSPRIPEKSDIKNLLENALKYIPADRLWINPDCGLKTRNWPEVEIALKNMTEAAKDLRKKYEAI